MMALELDRVGVDWWEGQFWTMKFSGGDVHLVCGKCC